jgi:hypothetical protein
VKITWDGVSGVEVDGNWGSEGGNGGDWEEEGGGGVSGAGEDWSGRGLEEAIDVGDASLLWPIARPSPTPRRHTRADLGKYGSMS